MSRPVEDSRSVELSSCRALDTLTPRHMESGGFLSSCSCQGLSRSCASFVELSRAILSSSCRVPVEFPVELSRPGLANIRAPHRRTRRFPEADGSTSRGVARIALCRCFKVGVVSAESTRSRLRLRESLATPRLRIPCNKVNIGVLLRGDICQEQASFLNATSR